MEEKKIALLVDIENISFKYIGDIIDDLSQRGVICIKKVYCPIDKLAEESTKKIILKYNLEIKTLIKVSKEKNVSDFDLVIDAMEILYTKDIDCFAIASSDSDYNLLVRKLKAENKIVIGYGERKTKPEIRSNYHDFIFVENLSSQPDVSKKDLIKQLQVKSKDDLEKEIYSMIDVSDNEYVLLSNIKDKLCKKYPDFDERTYNFSKFSSFIRSMKSLKVEMNKEKKVYVVVLNSSSQKENKSKDIFSLDELKEVIIKVLKANNNKVNLGLINDLVKKEYPSFALKNYGFSRFKTLIEKSNWPEIGFDRKKNPTSIVLNAK